MLETLRLTLKWGLLGRVLFNLKVMRRAGELSLGGLVVRREGRYIVLRLKCTVFGAGKAIGASVEIDGKEVECEAFVDGRRYRLSDVSPDNPLVLIPGESVELRCLSEKRGSGMLRLKLLSEIAPNPYIAEFPVLVR